MTEVRIEGLTVRYGGVVPLDGVDLTIDGGAWGLIGPNGAGKTTFFNVLSGFARPAEGRITVDGEDLLSMRPHARARWGLRRTFQTEQAIRELTVADNVRLGYEHGRRGGAGEAVAAALDFVGLADQPHRLVGSLDMRGRRLVELARAVVGSPRLVLLDEPAAGLPDQESEELGALIRAVPERLGATVLLVDHDMALVSACCEKLAVLDFGRLVATGPTAEVLQDPLVLAAYLGTTEEVA
ncbi:ATP-binding cassette domain-containing protein [Nocardioides sp. GY 10127]|uniref:ABC transporter ATP-binding protein n=1 Tax=Nocardioides sp. GY 10127 TaxID=2569762 RepID=UPI0010A90C11|nr:ATP-binding cassette domain-containing protein [Nocardioides sp. GY 10127]TIC79993.1 ABC transporter ATP-binding protein [Nocardioides sp. GY 10127]